MPLTADWTTKLVTVPKSELTLISGTRYQITVDYLFRLARELNDSTQGIVETVGFPLYLNTSPTNTTPRILAFINGFLVVFEDGLYSVDIVDGNTNLDIVTVKNTVSVNTHNTAALINPSVLEAGVFAGQVIVDTVNGELGTDKTPDGRLIGTYKAPVKLIPDALVIAKEQGIRQITFISSGVINEDLSGGYELYGSSPFNVITINPVANVTGLAITNMSVVGEMDGLNTLRECNIISATNLSGFVFQVSLQGNITINSSINLMQCFSGYTGTGYPLVSTIPGAAIQIRDYSGSVGLAGVVDGNHSAGGQGGRLVIESSCTGGTIHARGSWFEIIDNSGPGCTVLDERATASGGLTVQQDADLTSIKTSTDFIKDIEGGKWTIVGNQMVFYKADNITEVARFSLDNASAPTTRTRV